MMRVKTFCYYTLFVFCFFLIFLYTLLQQFITFTKHNFGLVSESIINKTVIAVTQDFIHNNIVLEKYPFNADRACRNFSKRLYAEGTFEPTPLASYPGSGNTWTRHQIELASGIYTGSIYTDIDLISKGFLGEKESPYSGTTIVQKTHEKYSKKWNSKKGVLIIRNPYDAIVSFVQYLESGHLGQASIRTFRNKAWPAYVLSETYKWISFAKSWIESPIKILLIHYENLLGMHKSSELEKLCHFLNVSCKNLPTKCFQNHEDGFFHRKRKLLFTPVFPEWVRIKVNKGIDYLDMLLKQRSHSGLPLHKYKFYTKNQGNLANPPRQKP